MPCVWETRQKGLISFTGYGAGRARRYLEGNHILLSGPRRLGKTSLLQRLAEDAEEKGLLARLVDVEDINSAEAFVGAFDVLSR